MEKVNRQQWYETHPCLDDDMSPRFFNAEEYEKYYGTEEVKRPVECHPEYAGPVCDERLVSQDYSVGWGESAEKFVEKTVLENLHRVSAFSFGVFIATLVAKLQEFSHQRDLPYSNEIMILTFITFVPRIIRAYYPDTGLMKFIELQNQVFNTIRSMMIGRRSSRDTVRLLARQFQLKDANLPVGVNQFSDREQKIYNDLTDEDKQSVVDEIHQMDQHAADAAAREAAQEEAAREAAREEAANYLNYPKFHKEGPFDPHQLVDGEFFENKEPEAAAAEAAAAEIVAAAAAEREAAAAAAQEPAAVAARKEAERLEREEAAAAHQAEAEAEHDEQERQKRFDLEQEEKEHQEVQGGDPYNYWNFDPPLTYDQKNDCYDLYEAEWKESTCKELRKKYLRLAKQNHPDKLRKILKRDPTAEENEAATARFGMIGNCWDKSGCPPVLSLTNKAAKLRWSAENRHRVYN